MTSLLIALKQTTRPYHQSLEQTLDFLSPNLSHTDYLRLIKAFWGYYCPLEARLARVPALTTWMPDLSERIKLSLLEKDLVALGVEVESIAQLPQCNELPACTDVAQALGCLYVMEGATLGGQVISRHLKQSLDLDARNGAAFFSSYGDATGLMWQTFREQLTTFKADEERVIGSACMTFLTLEKWFSLS